MMKMVTASNCQ